jgi:hypothetical protein
VDDEERVLVVVVVVAVAVVVVCGRKSDEPGRAGKLCIMRTVYPLALSTSTLYRLPTPLNSDNMARPEFRQRERRGTIPSMETTHNELKDNTIIIGNSPSSSSS